MRDKLLSLSDNCPATELRAYKQEAAKQIELTCAKPLRRKSRLKKNENDKRKTLMRNKRNKSDFMIANNMKTL
jgi:hypothetical protein